MSDAGAAGEPTPGPRPAKRMRRILRWTISAAVIGVVGWFFASALARNWAQVAAEHLRFDWLWVVATLVFAVAVPVTGLAWGRIVRVLDPAAAVSAVEAVAVQSASWLLKYIPGQVGSVVNKVAWAKRKGISRTLVIITFVYENVFLQLDSLVPSAVILLIWFGPGIFGDNLTLLLLPVLVVVPLAAVLWKPFFHKVLDVPARRVLKRPVPPEYILGTGRTLAALGEFLLPRILNGVGFVLIAATVTDVTPDLWLPLGAAYVLAGAVGILAVFVPSGLGVREAVIVLILSQSMPVSEAIVISLLARLFSTIADGIIALIYAGLRATIPKEIRP